MIKKTLAEKFNSLSTDSALSILTAAAVMVEAKSSLDKSDFSDFLTLTRYDNKSASVRKWLRIGQSYIRLKPIVNKLPPIWTTLYKISSLSTSDFEKLEKSMRLCSSITAREITEILGETAYKKTTKKIQITLSFDNKTDPKKLKEIYEKIINLMRNVSHDLHLTKEMEAMLETAENISTLLKIAA